MAVTAEMIGIFLRDLLPWTAAYLVVVLSLNLEYGYLGIPNFGKVLAVSGGAFLVGSLPAQLVVYGFNLAPGLNFFDDHAKIMPSVNDVLANNPMLAGGLLVITLGAAMAVGGLLGFISSYPAARLREDYLAMTLLAMGEVLIIVGNNYKPLIGGTLGVFSPSFFAAVPVGLRGLVNTAFISVVAVAVALFVHKLTSSPLGRVLRAIRDNDVLAESLGKDLQKYRIRVLVLGGALAALGGALFAMNSGAVNAKNFGRVEHTFIPWVMVVVGGAANNLGAAVGAFILVILVRVIDVFKPFFQPFVPFDVVWLNPILLSLSLILVLMYKPTGIVPEKATKTH
jgi:branched-chain amino acid transport system permease protein